MLKFKKLQFIAFWNSNKILEDKLLDFVKINLEDNNLQFNKNSMPFRDKKIKKTFLIK